VLSNLQITFVYTWSYKDQNIEEYVEIMNLTILKFSLCYCIFYKYGCRSHIS